MALATGPSGKHHAAQRMRHGLRLSAGGHPSTQPRFTTGASAPQVNPPARVEVPLHTGSSPGRFDVTGRRYRPSLGFQRLGLWAQRGTPLAILRTAANWSRSHRRHRHPGRALSAAIPQQQPACMALASTCVSTCGCFLSRLPCPGSPGFFFSSHRESRIRQWLLMRTKTMNAYAALPGQVRHDFACENFDDYDRREEMEACQRRGGEEFARRMELDLLDDSEFYEWADNGGTEELARIFEADNDRVFLQLVIRAHAVGGLEDLTGPIMERLKEHATKYEMGRLSWLVD